MVPSDARGNQARISEAVIVGADIDDRRRAWSPYEAGQLCNGNCIWRGQARPLQKREYGRDISAKASRGNRDHPLAVSVPKALSHVNDPTRRVPSRPTRRPCALRRLRVHRCPLNVDSPMRSLATDAGNGSKSVKRIEFDLKPVGACSGPLPR